MQLITCTLAIAILSACSSGPPLQTKHSGGEAVVKSKKAHAVASPDRGWLQLQGMPAVEAAQLGHWWSTATVMEAADERGDTLELYLAVSDPNRSIDVGIAVTKFLDRTRGLQITGTYPFGEYGPDGRSHQLNVLVDGVPYTSRGGSVTIDHAPGTISGTFVADLMRADDSSAPWIHVEGHFDGQLGGACEVLPPATPGPDAQGGWGNVEGEPASRHWIAVRLDHPFCRNYW